MKLEVIPTENWFHKDFYIHKATGKNTDYPEMPDGWDVTCLKHNENLNVRFDSVEKAELWIDMYIEKGESDD
tara:strand:+ start:1245 stop:1460 length:216 start_codon:yes stop_codon:yes gene_type:complete